MRPQGSPPQLLRLLLLALWFGLLAGLLEIFMVQMALRAGVPARLSADYVWMAPLANVLFAVATVLVASAVLLLRKSSDWAPGILAALSGFLLLSVGWHVESLHRGAVVLLAAGAGSQLGRLATVKALQPLRKLVPVSALAMAALVGWLGVAERRGAARVEAEGIRSLPAAPAGAINVLLLILDTVREQSTGLSDSTLTTTPALDAFAKGGVVFDQAFAPAPWTLPSHATFFTGRFPQEHRANWGIPLDGRYPTLASFLASKGYLTAGFVGNLQFATRASGLGRGFIHYDDYQAGLGQAVLSTSIGRVLSGATWLRRLTGRHDLLNRRTAADVTDDFLAWTEHSGSRPFFAFVNFFDAHEPYFPPGRSGSILWPGPRWTRYEHVVGLNSGANAWIQSKWTLTPAETQVHAAGYNHAVSQADHELGRLLSELDRRGVLAHTLVIIAGDHGEQLGEHRLFEHINSLYLPTLHVPLVIAGPTLPRGLRVPATVGLRDLPATVVDFLGLGAGVPFPGRSLSGLWRGAGGEDTVYSTLKRGLVRQGWYPIGKGPEMFSLVTSEHHYIRNGDGSEELYERRTDPEELRNRVADAGSETVLGRFRDYLVRLAAANPGRSPGR